MSSKLTVITNFNTSLSLNNNVIGKRVLASIVDLIIIAVYLVIISWLIPENPAPYSYRDASRINSGIMAILGLPALFYTLISETLTGGYTIGKFICRIKVVKINGFQPNFVDFFLRWIFRVVDIWIVLLILVLTNSELAMIGVFLLTGVVGLIAAIWSKKNQRIGDIVAGTAVVNVKNKESIDITIIKNISEDYVPSFPSVTLLSDNDARIIKETYELALKTKDSSLIYRLIQKIEMALKIKNESKDPYGFVDTILKDFNYYTQQ